MPTAQADKFGQHCHERRFTALFSVRNGFDYFLQHCPVVREHKGNMRQATREGIDRLSQVPDCSGVFVTQLSTLS